MAANGELLTDPHIDIFLLLS